MTASFGDVTGEYLALRNGAGLMIGMHDVVWVDGADAVSFLDELLSQSIETISVGGAAPSLLLAPRGKLRATLWVLRGENRVGLVSDAGRGEVVLGDLARFRLRVDVELTPEEGLVVDVWGPAAATSLRNAGLTVPEAPGWAAEGGSLVAALPFTHAKLPRFVTIGTDPEELGDHGVVPAGVLAATAVRIEAGEPVMGADFDDGTIPQEGGVENAVDFDKGCYLGQELVARIHSRGRVNRHLRGVVVEENVLPPTGSEIVVGERTVGALSSVAESLELRAPVGLALVRREVEPGDAVELRWESGRAPARIAALPLDASL